MNSTQVDDTCILMREHWRRRVHHMRSANRVKLSTGGFFRSVMGWRRDLEDKDRKRIEKQVSRIIENAISGAEHHEEDRTFASHFGMELNAAAQAIKVFNGFREELEKGLCKSASTLPFWNEWEDVLYFGDLGLATIVGIAGNLSNFEKDGQLRKRCGLAPFVKDGVAKACSTWRMKGGLESEDWRPTLDDGSINYKGALYVPQNRSFIYAHIGTIIIGNMGNGPRLKVGQSVDDYVDYKGRHLTRYQKYFVYRLRREAAMNPEMQLKTKEDGTESFSKIAKLRAQRATESKVINDVHAAWKRASSSVVV